MATFLQKNRKKSALAALLLFLKLRKSVLALLLLVAIASFLFVSPSSLIIHFPGGPRVAAGVAWIAGKLGVDISKWGLGGGPKDFSDLLAAFRAAKEGGGKAGWSAFMQGAGAAGGDKYAGGGSLDFVKGSAKDLEAAGGSGAKLPKPGSVQGVLNPDDAKNRGEGEGVALSDEDVGGERAGFVKSAFAGGFGSNASGGMLSGGAFAGSGFFGGTRAASSGKLGDMVKAANVKSPTAPGVQIQKGAKGQLSAARASVINARTRQGMVGSHTISGQRAFVQLAAGRGRAAISVAPNCTASSSCPAEFATTNTGAVYDGNAISGASTDLLTAPNIDGISTPNLPNTGLADSYIAEAEAMNADAEKCRAADEQYGPQEMAYDQQQEELSKEFDAMACGQGGCSQEKLDTCNALGDQMKSLCRSTMGVRCQHMRACPLTANNNCSASECDGPARQKKNVSDTNDGIQSTTQD